MERRRFLTIGLAGGAWFVALYALWNKFGPAFAVNRVGVKDYLHLGERAALEAITPNQDFYITSKGLTPRVDVSDWRLEIDGLVRNRVELSLDEIQNLPVLDRVLTLECISNPIGGPSIGNARWQGTDLGPLLERARPRPEARSALLHAADGFTTGIPLERLRAEENFLAYGMNGEPLPPDHGFPVRVFFPGKYGMKQPKWLTRIELVGEHPLGFWEQRGWSDTAERQTRAVIDNPSNKEELSRGSYLIAGYAVADASGIARVEVNFNESEPWHPAQIVSCPSPDVWAFWTYEWSLPGPGSYRLRARAVNGRGEIQTAEESGPGPEGATGYHSLTVRVLG